MNINVLFVCLGNICRSPMAEGIFNELISQKSLHDQITCDSAGTGNYHIGKLPDHRTIEVCNDNNITLTHRCRQLKKEDFDTFAYIIAMDNENLKKIKSLTESAAHDKKVFLMGDFGKIYKNLPVPDPYYGSKKDFEQVYLQLLDTCEGLLQHLLAKKEAY